MSLFSKQQFFCNACGKEVFVTCQGMLGSFWKVCSTDCLREVKWREVCSIMNKEYYPDPLSLKKE